MARVLSTDVVRVLESAFPWVTGSRGTAHFEPRRVQAIVDIAERVLDELIALDSADYIRFLMAVSILKRGADILDRSASLYTAEECEAAQTIHNLLQKCPDNYPAPGSADPDFMDDVDLRFDIRSDIAEIDRAFQNSEWKAATVLAGSVIEALLLWALQNRVTHQRVRTAPSAKKDRLDKWYIGDYSAVANELA